MIAPALAFAAPPPGREAPREEPIVVTGQRLTAEELERYATDFVRGTGVASGQTPAARWAQRVCPRVVGLSREQASTVETKMRSIAEAAAIRTAPSGCDPNVIVSFTTDPKAVVREVSRRSPGRLSDVPSNVRASLLGSEEPIRWWYSTTTNGRDGSGGHATPSGWVASDEAQGGGNILPGSGPSLQMYDSSIVSTQVHRVLTSATVVVDARKVLGSDLDAVASYAAFVAFAEVRQLDFSPSGSILSLFKEASAPRDLSEHDAAFLRALYRLPLDRSASYHRSFLVRQVVAQRKTGG
jgi:hypothetical protein